MHKTGFYEKFIKRPMDIFLSLFAFIFLVPILVFVSIIIRLKLGSPVIFKQSRPGLNEKIFKLYKFRTMTDEKDVYGNLLPDSERLTKLGKFLRSTSIDELPSLINILKGDLSLVGPRPLAAQYLPYYSEYEKQRHLVKPGLTGYSQVNGRNSVTWEERFAHDVYYVENLSFILDIKIILKTIKLVMKRKNIGTRGVDSPIDFDTYRSSVKKED